jgi:hypothetical protein
MQAAYSWANETSPLPPASGYGGEKYSQSSYSHTPTERGDVALGFDAFSQSGLDCSFRMNVTDTLEKAMSASPPFLAALTALNLEDRRMQMQQVRNVPGLGKQDVHYCPSTCLSIF